MSKSHAITLATNPQRVSRHAFWPLILNPQKVVRRSGKKGGKRPFKTKTRPIVFAAHSDSHIYAYYASLIDRQLETLYQREGLDCVLAYRTFDPPKSNVHFAKSVFDEIKERGECEVVAMDVEGFFDVMDHEILKCRWLALLNVDRLPDDHFAVYRACTRDFAVSIPKLRTLLRGGLRRRRGITNSAICAPEVFREKIRPHLKPRHELIWKAKGKDRPTISSPGPLGIPQGLPISSVLANLYMLETDRTLQAAIQSMGGSYRRYSDDLLVIVPVGRSHDAEALILHELEKVKLTVNNNKTERHRFVLQDNKQQCLKLNTHGDTMPDGCCGYLGLAFDGRQIRLRASTISRFRMKARKAIGRALKKADDCNESTIRRRKLYTRLTALGYGQAYCKQIRRAKPSDRLPPNIPRIGMFRYLNICVDVTGSTAIERQRRQLHNFVFRCLDKAQRKLDLWTQFKATNK